MLTIHHLTLWIFIDVLKDQRHLENIKQEQFIASTKKQSNIKIYIGIHIIQILFRKNT